MKRTGFLYSLMFLCLSASGIAYGQSETKSASGSTYGQPQAKKACPFNIVGTWRSEAATADPILFRFAADGTVTLLSPSTAIPDSDFETLAAVKYKLDKPTAPKRLDIIAVRGNEVFGRG